MAATKEFTVVDLNAQCETRGITRYGHDLLVQLGDYAASLIGALASEIWRAPEEFEMARLLPGTSIGFRWRATSPTTGIATVRESTGEQDILSVSLLVSGIDSSADQLTLGAYQQHVVRELHDTGFEPAFGLADLPQRPLLATIGLRAPRNETDRVAFALADRCFAAAFFRKLGVA